MSPEQRVVRPAVNRVRRCGLVVALLLAALALFPVAVFAAKEHGHDEVFLNGPPDESRIAATVRHELLMLPWYGVFDDIAFRVEGNTVILEGAVTRPTLKSDAQRVVQHIEGVGQVINNIEVLPPSPMDDQIRLAEYRAVYGDPSISTRYGYRALPPIHIIVKNGHVRLEGVVANEADKNLIGIRANGVPGVFSVENDLQVEGS